MFSKPWVRCLVCLVMVCVILINCSPIKADAFVIGAIAVPAQYVIAAALIGLGVCAASDPSGFDGVVSSCQDFLAGAGYVIDGAIKVASLSPSQASFTYGLSGGLIDTIRGWLFGEGAVLNSCGYCGSVVSPGWSISSPGGKVYSPTSECYFVGYYQISDGYTWCYYSFVPLDLTSSILGNCISDGKTSYMGTTQVKLDGSNKYINIPWDTYMNSSSNIPASSLAGLYNVTGLSVSGNTSDTIKYLLSADVDPLYSITTDVALHLAKIAAPAYSLSKGYAEWATNALSVPGVDVGEPDQDEVVVYPIGLGQTYEETRDKVQTDVWAGTSSYVDTSTDTGVAGDTVTATGLKGWLDAMLTAIGGWFADVVSGLRDIGASITSLPQSIADAVLAGITAIFVPSTDFLTAKVEAIRAEFAFADSIISTVEYLKGALSGLSLEPPVIYLNLADSRGSYYLGGKVAILDLRWYAEYKPTGDAILSAFLWLAFVWRNFMKLPGIISGMPGDFVMKGFESAGLDSKLPSRSLEYAAKRADLNDKVSAGRTIFKKGSGK